MEFIRNPSACQSVRALVMQWESIKQLSSLADYLHSIDAEPPNDDNYEVSLPEKCFLDFQFVRATDEWNNEYFKRVNHAQE